MDRCNQHAQFHTNNTRSCVPVYSNVQRTRTPESYCYPKSNRGYQRNRYYKYFLPITICLSNIAIAPVTLAETVGGVSATASPIANSSGSVTNQAIQVLQGPYITNTYGGGIQCQGPTMNFTPYVTGTASAQKPYEPYYQDPVYDMRDLDEDGTLDNPGSIIYHVPTRTGQKDNYSIGVGFSATWSKPLDKTLQDQCKKAAATQIALQEQLTANKRLDFEIARLKNCGELMRSGIQFRPGTRYATICADVMVQGVSYIKPHVHNIPNTEPTGTAEDLGSFSIGKP